MTYILDPAESSKKMKSDNSSAIPFEGSGTNTLSRVVTATRNHIPPDTITSLMLAPHSVHGNLHELDGMEVKNCQLQYANSDVFIQIFPRSAYPFNLK
jgi:hypothetical protein